MVEPGGRGARSESGKSVFDRLAQRKLVIVSGKGGVGRTTMATIIGLALAARGRKTLVATTGHDDRLAWMLGHDQLRDTPAAVDEHLHIQRLIPQTCLREYGTLVIRSARVASAVFDNGVVSKLLHAIPGLDDFAVVGKAWHEAARGDDYDVVVFDGPATGHLLYTLGLPHAILDTVASGPLTKEARLMQDTLADPALTEAVLVGLPERWPLTELAELGASLQQRIGIALQTIIVNGIWPAPIEGFGDGGGDEARAAALSYLAELSAVGAGHRREVTSWLASEIAQGLGIRGVLGVPWRWDGLCDRPTLHTLWQMLDRPETDAPVADVG
ncbi:MAG: ArsA family ATPase [Myxococcota bacterium]